MIDKTEVSESEPLKNHLEVKNENGVFIVSSPLVELASNKEPLKLAITLEKVPQLIEDGVEINEITIDRKSPKLQEMLKEAASLREIPEREKPRKIMELLRSKVSYAYDNMIAELGKTNPSLAKWVTKNITDCISSPISLSEIIDSGFGVCRHLSVAMLALAKETGINGSLVSNATPDSKPELGIKNVIRRDNGESLFKTLPVGTIQSRAGHIWVEFQMSNGEWIPVDPSTLLVGDTEEEMAIFSDANYRGVPHNIEFIYQEPKGKLKTISNHDLWFYPGEAKHTGIIEINTYPLRDRKTGVVTTSVYQCPLVLEIFDRPPESYEVKNTAGLYPKIDAVEIA